MIKEFTRILIDKDATIIDAMRLLDSTAEKILFVVENGNLLIGSLTDGDIRRWILNDGSLTDIVQKVCYKDTFTVSNKYNLENVKKEILKRKIVYVPVIDNNRTILEFLVWDRLFNGEIKRKTKNTIDNPIVIMAGGKGTRLDPFTKILPKPLIPIGDKTILELIIDKFLQYNVNHFYISINHKAKIIKSYFEEINPTYSITYLNEEKPLGTIGAIKQIEGKVNKEIFLTNCDIIIDTDYSEILKHHRDNNNRLTIVSSVKNYRIPYGVCAIENGGTLLEIVEKPEYNFLVNTGMYVINPDLLRFIPHNDYFHATNLIEKLKTEREKIGIYPIGENAWTDIGEWVEYKKAVEKFKL